MSIKVDDHCFWNGILGDGKGEEGESVTRKILQTVGLFVSSEGRLCSSEEAAGGRQVAAAAAAGCAVSWGPPSLSPASPPPAKLQTQPAQIILTAAPLPTPQYTIANRFYKLLLLIFSTFPTDLNFRSRIQDGLILRISH